jgi:hypothetical protein
MDIFKIDVKLAFIIYFLLDTFLVGIGMGVPIFSILMGFPVGWYLSKRLILSERSFKDILYNILKYAIYTSLVTLGWMVVIWGPISTMLLNPHADFVNFGIPMILYDPKISFIGWIILMVFISPFLQLLTTIFTAHLTLWRGIKIKKKYK